MPLLQPSIKARALRLLSTREHSRLDLERKLAQFEVEPGELGVALDELQAKGFISEQRVLESVLHRRSAKLGATRIRQELSSKGLEPELVRQALSQLQDSELERAQEIWRKKFGAPAADAKGRAKQQRFLLARGFGAEVLRHVVPGIVPELGFDDASDPEPDC